VGSIVGVGIFNLPASLAAYGPITLISMGLTMIAALALALLFASLSRRMPAHGGPYAYARAAFGNGLGFANAWSYWITAWAGNAAIAVGWVLYVEVFVNKVRPSCGRSCSCLQVCGSPPSSISPASRTSTCSS
jgi:APA family basic amino acid/polyamine antiporter